MLFTILVLLMIQLQHFGKAMLVLLTGPLGIIGAAAALLITGSPFGFVAISYAMMGGIIVATVLTILVLPASYAFFFRLRRAETEPRSATSQRFGRVHPAAAG
jgi:multidrug efflux pump subunit AcrB